MNVFKIAWRSVQHRGLGSLLTIISMALGVMMVVAVLTIHGVVSQSFRNNQSFGYNVVIGSRGGSLQLTMNTVYLLSKPLEPVPFEYYLAFRDQESREPYLKESIAYKSMLAREATLELAAQLQTGFSPDLGSEIGLSVANAFSDKATREMAIDQMTINENGKYMSWAEMVIPMALGDYLGQFRVIGTTEEYFSKLMLNIESEEKIEFAEGRGFRNFDSENGYFEAVIGSTAARVEGIKLGQQINPIHGDPNSPGAHTHEQGFTVVGIMKPTGTPNDRGVFVNLEGFYLMEDHAKPVTEGQPAEDTEGEFDEFDPDGEFDDWDAHLVQERLSNQVIYQHDAEAGNNDSNDKKINPHLLRERLPMEQREVTALLILTNRENDEFGLLASSLSDVINNGGFLEPTLNWTMFRPANAQVAPQAVVPIMEVTQLFAQIVNPVQLVLLGLTIMICVVSGLSILVGIYNSMNQRKHEIAVMRALGARRGKVMSIMMLEAILLALAGGGIGWIVGHWLNSLLSPYVEANTGVSIGFFDFAPGIPVFAWIPGISEWAGDSVQYLRLSPEFLLIPGLIILAVLVGIYPAISAYRTDVSQSL